MDAIAIEGLTFRYGDRDVLRGLSCRIVKGRFTVILGRNGGGKSTLLKLMAGLLSPSEGRIVIGGRDLSTTAGGRRAALVGYLPQFHSPVFPFRVADVVLTGRAASIAFFPAPGDRKAAADAMEAVGIPALADRPYTELSGGERQLVMVARLLAQQPEVVLLDEPISHLDLANQARLIALLRRLADSGITVVVVLHDPNAAALAADHVLLLSEGAILSELPAPVRWDAGQLETLYGTGIDLVPYRETSLVVHHLGGESREAGGAS